MWGGGGGEDENPNPDYYVSIEELKSGRGFAVMNSSGLLLSIMPPGDGSESKPAGNLEATIESDFPNFTPPQGGENPDSVTVNRGNFTVPGANAEIDMDYYVIGGSSGHGILFIHQISADDHGALVEAIRTGFALNEDGIPDSLHPTQDTIKTMSILVDLDFSSRGGAAKLYFNCFVEHSENQTTTSKQKHPNNKRTSEQGVTFHAL